MEKKETIKSKIKKVWNKHKGTILFVGSVVAGGAAAVALMKDEKSPSDEELNNMIEDTVEEKKQLDLGRDCLITYTVEDTGEVLWKDRCYESYVEDMKDWGMEYESIRKLNGLE